MPIISAGASTVAMFYAVTRRIANREQSVASDFWSAFKSSFKRATIIWLLMLTMTIIVAINIWVYVPTREASGFTVFILSIQFIFLLEMSLMSVFIFPIIARFDLGIGQTLKSAFFMANRHLLTSVTCVILTVVASIGVLSFPPLLFVAPGLYALIASFMIVRIFKRYRPEMDRNPEVEVTETETQKVEDRC